MCIRDRRGIIGKTDHAQQVQVAWELERVTQVADSYLFHEYLLAENRPYHHREVVAMLRSRGLAYLCDSAFNDSAGREPERLAAALDQMDVAGEDRDALIDFLGCRTFRSSVFCRAAAASGLIGPDLEGIQAFYVGAELQPESGPPDLTSDDPERFRLPQGSTITASGAILKAALAILASVCPRYLRVDELVARAAAATSGPALNEEEVRTFHRDVVAMYRAGVVDLQGVAPRGLGADGRGRLHALARLEVQRGMYPTTSVHSLLPIPEELRDQVREIAVGREEAASAGATPLARCRALLGRWGLLEPPAGPG